MHIYMCLGYVVYGQMSDRISIYTVRSCSTVTNKKSKSTLRNNVDFATCDGICCKMLKQNKKLQQKLFNTKKKPKQFREIFKS